MSPTAAVVVFLLFILIVVGGLWGPVILYREKPAPAAETFTPDGATNFGDRPPSDRDVPDYQLGDFIDEAGSFLPGGDPGSAQWVPGPYDGRPPTRVSQPDYPAVAGRRSASAMRRYTIRA